MTQPTISSSSSIRQPLSLAAFWHKTTESVVCEVRGFPYVSLLSLSLLSRRFHISSSPAASSSCSSTFVPFLPRSSFRIHHPWTPTTAYKSLTPGVLPEAHRVLSLSSPHHHPLNLNRHENGRPTAYNLRSNNRTKFQMTTFQHIVTSTLTPQQCPTLPPTPAVPFPSSVRTCYFRP